MAETIRNRNVTKRYKLLCYMQDAIPEWQRDSAPLYQKVWKRYDTAFKKWDVLENNSHWGNMPKTATEYIAYLNRHGILLKPSSAKHILFFVKSDWNKFVERIIDFLVDCSNRFVKYIRGY